MRLKDKVAIVTGAAKGLGKEMAILFANEGAKVIALDVNEPEYSHPHIEYHHLDVSDSKACFDFFTKITKRFESIDVLVNNAGITRDALTYKMTEEQWDQVLNVNLKGVFNLGRLIGPLMQRQKGGSIINVSSVVGIYGNIGQANYAASKAGMIGLSKSWAKEFAMKKSGVRCNALAPGYTMTDILKTVPQDLLDKFASQTMLGRLGEAEDIAKVALFLASDDSAYITGQTISVDGGMRL